MPPNDPKRVHPSTLAWELTCKVRALRGRSGRPRPRGTELRDWPRSLYGKPSTRIPLLFRVRRAGEKIEILVVIYGRPCDGRKVGDMEFRLVLPEEEPEYERVVELTWEQ